MLDMNFDEVRPIVRKFIALQPFSTLVGVNVTVVEPGYIEMEVPFRKDLTQQHGFIHGGVVGYLADNSCGAAAGTVAGNIVTQEYKINFLAPAVGEKIIAKASVIRAGKKQVVVRSDVYALKDGEEKIIATALSTLMITSYDVAK